MVYRILFELHCILIGIDCGYFSCIKLFKKSIQNYLS